MLTGMSPITELLVLLSILALFINSCGKTPHSNSPLISQQPWTVLTQGSWSLKGDTPEMELVVKGDEGTTFLMVESAKRRCFQMDYLNLEDQILIANPETGPYCQSCQHRVSLAQDAGLFPLPRKSGRARFRWGLRDCQRLAPNANQLQTDFRISYRTVPNHTKGRLIVDFVLPISNSLSAASVADLVAQTATYYQSTGLTVTLGQIEFISEAPQRARFHVGDLSALQLWSKKASQAIHRHNPGVSVYIGPCLIYHDPVLNRDHEIAGYSPRIPGGAGAADGIFLQLGGCGHKSEQLQDNPQSLVKILAHELGHYLGLYHAIEQDGRTDHLNDTDENNMMYYLPSLASAQGFSATQAAIMRAHPRIIGL